MAETNARTVKDDKALEIHKARLLANVQQQRVSADFAMLAIRSMIVVSSGAVILLGNLWPKSGGALAGVTSAMQPAVALFAAALCLSIATAMAAFVSALAQVYRQTAPGTWIGKHARGVRWTAIIFGALSFIVFAFGAVTATVGLLH